MWWFIYSLCLSVLFRPILSYTCRTIEGNKEQLVKELEEGLNAWKNLSGPYYKQQDFNPEYCDYKKAYEEDEEFDFIIVGSGSSGTIIASRLSEKRNWKILLLEAGPEENELVTMPGSYPYLGQTQYDWGYKTVPQKRACLSANNHQCFVRAGKGLGGGTLVNGFFYTHGHPEDYDDWEALGNEGWSWKHVLPYLKKPEKVNRVQFVDWKYHGEGGNLFIENFPFYTNLSTEILKAASELGRRVGDFNDATGDVYSLPYGTIHNGRRFTVAQGYLSRKVRQRTNLVIKTNSQVIKIIINKKLLEAEGVEYLQEGILKVARARKEVIISAGSLNTPQILMLSGIGPTEHLKTLGIDTIIDLPVGYNLNNHLSYWGLVYTFTQPLVNPQSEHESIEDYLNCKGPFTSIGLDAVGYYKSKFLPNAKKPNIEFQFSTRPGGIPGWSKANQTNLVLEVNILHPLSRGRVTLQDKDPLHYPKIDLNYLSDPGNTDVEMVLEGIHLALELMNSSTMQALGSKLIPLDLPQCNDLSGDDYWRCTIRFNTGSLSHYCGSAKMGSVVDNKLRVRGCKKLRVADGSVIPVTMSGHLMSPVNMIGEKAAALIKSSWK